MNQPDALGKSDSEPCPHLVQFYETDAFLIKQVTDFIVKGLGQREPVIVIATPEHRAGFLKGLQTSGVDVATQQRNHRLLMLDAQETLDKFMVDGLPDPVAFRTVVGGALAGMKNGDRHLRAYGEMVDLLWRAGNQPAALRLEELWNDLANTHSFSLLCAYVIDSFYKQLGLPDVCATHNHVLPVERPGGDDASSRTVKSLVAEIAHRTEIERALRASLRDVRRAEEEASRAREALQSFLDDAVVPIHTIDADGIIRWANRSELALLGYSTDEYIGQPIQKFHVDALVIEDVLKRLDANETLRDYEVRVRAKDGSIRYLLVSSNALMDRGELVHIRCFSRDVTEQKYAEQERDRMIEELTRTVRLNEMFASVLAHDLRNPLGTIVMAGNLLEAKLTDPNHARSIQRLLSSAGRMMRMIDQLLDFSRARMSGGLPLERKSIDLAAIARDVVEEQRVTQPTLTIELSSTGDLRGDWDANRMAQVFSNLVGNAVQHGAPGVPVVVRLDGTDPDSIRIEIRNRGTIKEELFPILFAPFRGSHQNGGKRQGLGLGLFITDQIVRAHAGTIEASSRDDTTTFTIWLPRHHGAPALTTFDAVPTRTPEAITPREPRQLQVVRDDILRDVVATIREYAIFLLDPRGNILTWNRGAQHIKGYTADEAIGKHFSIFYPREDVRAGKCERELEIAMRNGQYEEQGWRIRKDGTPFWANVLITAIHDRSGTHVGFGKVTRDMTDERLAREAAHRSEERFRLLVEGVRDYAIFMLDPEGYVTSWNVGAERIKGYRADEIVGRHFSVFYPKPDVEAGKTERELETAIEEGRFEEEGWRVRKDGSRFWASVVITPMFDQGRKLLGFAKITRDLTDRRKHEEERLRLAHAQEAVRLRDEFLSIASHELKTPMTVLQMQLDALRDRLTESDPALAAKLERTSRAGHRLNELVETLLDVSRIASGRFELKRERTDLADVAKEAVDRLHDAAEAAGCKITCKLDEPLIGMFDRSRIDQVFTNLLSNAIKYAPRKPIEIATRREGSDAIIEVRDHGPGLPEGREANLFARFERATSMKHYGGLGLGLYVVSQIAEAHGGSATAHNMPEGGACFRVRLEIEPRSEALSA